MNDNSVQRRLERALARAVIDFGMLEDGDRVMVCVSGGKDSYTMLHLLRELSRRAPIRFALKVVNVDQGHPGYPKHILAEYMQRAGYRIVPVNPQEQEVLGEKCYPDLTEIPIPVEIVDIFRRSEFVPEIVDQAIAIGAKAIWMQEGVVHEEAAAKARAAGLDVVMDRCILKDHRILARA